MIDEEYKGFREEKKYRRSGKMVEEHWDVHRSKFIDKDIKAEVEGMTGITNGDIINLQLIKELKVLNKKQ